MAARAHEISLEAGSKMAAAMKEVIGAAAGLTAFAIESARELVQYMVRRGQMTQDEADKLMRDVEHAHGTKPKMKISAAPAKQEKAAKPVVKAAAPAPTPAPPAAPAPAPAAKPKAKAAPAPKAAAKTPAKKNPKKK